MANNPHQLTFIFNPTVDRVNENYEIFVINDFLLTQQDEVWGFRPLNRRLVPKISLRTVIYRIKIPDPHMLQFLVEAYLNFEKEAFLVAIMLNKKPKHSEIFLHLF